METLQLSHEDVLELFDYKDGQLIRKTGRKGDKGSVAGCIHKGTGYIHVKIKKKTFKAHRLVFLLHHGYMPDIIDHIDGDKTNNRIENLRSATKSENSQNQRVRSTNKSGIKGVSFSKHHNKWVVGLCKNYKSMYFGLYDDLELAELVAVEAANKFHNQFSSYRGVLNGKA